jgi:hypothetical protein
MVRKVAVPSPQPYLDALPRRAVRSPEHRWWLEMALVAMEVTAAEIATV